MTCIWILFVSMVLSHDMTTKVEAAMEHKRKFEEIETKLSDLKKEKDQQQKLLVEATESVLEALGVKKCLKKQRNSLDLGSSS